MGLRCLRRCSFPELRISGGAMVLGAMLLLTVPVQWVAAAAFAGLCHELGHLLCLRRLRIPVFRVRIGACGAEIETGDLEPGQELRAALAGPAAGLLLAALWKTAPRCAACALVQSAWNLLPAPPMDGGRAIRALGRLLQEKQEKPVAEDGLSGYNDSD